MSEIRSCNSSIPRKNWDRIFGEKEEKMKTQYERETINREEGKVCQDKTEVAEAQAHSSQNGAGQYVDPVVAVNELLRAMEAAKVVITSMMARIDTLEKKVAELEFEIVEGGGR